MKQRVIWEGIELWPHEAGDTAGPEGTVLAEYIMDAYIEPNLRKELVRLARTESSLVQASRHLFRSLDERVSLQECLNWVKLLIEYVNKFPAADRSDTYKDSELPPLLMRGLFWVRPDEVSTIAGWKIQGKKRYTRLKSKLETPNEPMSSDALKALDRIGE